MADLFSAPLSRPGKAFSALSKHLFVSSFPRGRWQGPDSAPPQNGARIARKSESVD
jgi:hypothetical protein